MTENYKLAQNLVILFKLSQNSAIINTYNKGWQSKLLRSAASIKAAISKKCHKIGKIHVPTMIYIKEALRTPFTGSSKHALARDID